MLFLKKQPIMSVIKIGRALVYI